MGRPCLARPGHVHVANGKHRQEPANLDSADACIRDHRAFGNMRVRLDHGRRCDFKRHGHLRLGGSVGGICRLACRHRNGADGADNAFRLDGSSLDLLCSACGFVVCVLPSAAKDALDRSGRFDAESHMSMRSQAGGRCFSRGRQVWAGRRGRRGMSNLAGRVQGACSCRHRRHPAGGRYGIAGGRGQTRERDFIVWEQDD